MQEITIDLLNKKATSFYNRWIRNQRYSNWPTYHDAARLSYKASVRRAIKFQESEKQVAKEIREELTLVISEFLRKEDFNNLNVIKLMNKVYNTYKDRISDYTFGNAQKWVNIAIKYYLILEGYEEITDKVNLERSFHLVDNYSLFAVDSIMIGIIRKDLKVKFSGSWSKCNSRNTFITYWKNVKNKLNDLKPIKYEIGTFVNRTAKKEY